METADPAARLSAFERDGFLHLPGFLGAAALAEVRRHLERYLVEVVPALEVDVYHEDLGQPETLKQLQQLQRHDAAFAALAAGAPFERLAEELLGGPVACRNLQFFSKPPGAGLPTPPHQDGHYFMIEPCEAVTAWLALDAVDEANGCLRYVRGSHRAPLRLHARTATLGFSQGIPDYGTPEDLAREVVVTARPGDLVVHHARTIHRAGGNASAGRPRGALGFVYYSARAVEDVAAHRAYQERLAAELARTGRVR